MSVVPYRSKIDDKIVKIHMLAIFIVCVIFCILNIATGTILTGILTAVMGMIVPFVVLVPIKNADNITKGTFLTQATAVVIAVLSGTKGELHTMYAMLAANLAIGCMYNNVKNISIAWVLTDVLVLGALLGKDNIYAGAENNIIINGILGINIAAFLLRMLMVNIVSLLQKTEASAEETKDLLDQVRQKMSESTAMSERQQDIMQKVAGIASNLGGSTSSMLDISSRLTSASEEQESTVADICESVDRFAGESERCLDEAGLAAAAASESSEKLKESNRNMQQMVEVM